MSRRIGKAICLFVAIVIVCGISSNVFISAAMNDYCIEHGPWDDTCDGHKETRDLSHTFTYQGYLKVCEYKYVLYKTRSDCRFCEYYTYAHGPHSHGYRGHSTGPDGCGWSNDPHCRLTSSS